MTQITDLETWLLDNEGRVLRFWVFKKMFTPYEQQSAFTDESVYEDVHCTFGVVEEAVDLDGDWLLGFRIVEEESIGDEALQFWSGIHYYRLSELRMEYYEQDQPGFSGEDGDAK
jgi:hypothetical protein